MGVSTIIAMDGVFDNRNTLCGWSRRPTRVPIINAAQSACLGEAQLMYFLRCFPYAAPEFKTGPSAENKRSAVYIETQRRVEW